MPQTSTPHRSATPTNRLHRPPTPYPLPRFAPNSYHPHYYRRLTRPTPTITATARARTLPGTSRPASIEHSSARNNPPSSSDDATTFLPPYRTRLDPQPRTVRSDEESTGYRYRGSLVLDIARIVDGEVYRARRRRSWLAGDLFFDGRGIEEEEEDEEGDSAVDEGVFGGEDMSSVTRVSTSTHRCPLPQELECGICMCRKISVQFHECSHALCAPCAKALWRSRVTARDSCPGSFPCHLCRAEVREVGKLRARVLPGFGSAYRHGEQRFTVWKWEKLRRWASGGKEKRRKRLLPSGMTGLARRLCRGCNVY